MTLHRYSPKLTRRALAVALLAATTALPLVSNASGNDFNGDGRSDIFWRYQPAGYVATWYMNGASVGSSWFSAANIPLSSFTTLGTNDFNGDGKGDILWRSSTGDLSLWFGAVNGFTGGIIGASPAGWSLIGSGDINADGKSDLIWRYDATGQVAYWDMDGATVLGGAGVTPNAFGLRLVDVKDLNGDGRADLIWSNDTIRQLTGWLSLPRRPLPLGGYHPGDFSAALIANYTSGSTPFAAGDHNGDGRADIYFRYAGTTLFGYWGMNGTSVVSQNIVSSGLPSTYNMVAVGDYNGDGRDDIVWNDVGTGLFLWKCACNGFTPELIVDYPSPSIPAGWVPVL